MSSKKSKIPRKTLKKKPSSPCKSKQATKMVINTLNKQYRQELRHCEEEEYEEISKYFKPGKAKNIDLLEALQNFFRVKKALDSNYKLSLSEFIQLFPRDSSVNDNNFKRQHIFEQICRILLFFNYDNGVFGKKKEFYRKLESYSKTNPGITKNDLLNEQINEGSKAGSVDIFFRILKEGDMKNKDEFYCNSLNYDTPHNKENTYILVQNKYYTKESSDPSKYDATKMFTRASNILDKVDKFKIVLMVNSGEILDDKLSVYDKKDIDILGVKDIDDWFAFHPGCCLFISL